MRNCALLDLLVSSVLAAGCGDNQPPSDGGLAAGKPTSQQNRTLMDQLTQAAARTEPFSVDEIADANRFFSGRAGYPEGGFRTNSSALKLSTADLQEIAEIWRKCFFAANGEPYCLKAVTDTNVVFAKAIFPSKYIRGLTEVYFFRQRDGTWESWGEVRSRFD